MKLIMENWKRFLTESSLSRIAAATEPIEEGSLDEIAGDDHEEEVASGGCTYRKPRRNYEEWSAIYKGVSCGCRESSKAAACKKAKAKWKAKQRS